MHGLSVTTANDYEWKLCLKLGELAAWISFAAALTFEVEIKHGLNPRSTGSKMAKTLMAY